MCLTIKYHYGCSDSCIDKVPILPVERSHPAKPAFHRMGSHSEPFRPAKQAFHRTKPFLSQPFQVNVVSVLQQRICVRVEETPCEYKYDPKRRST